MEAVYLTHYPIPELGALPGDHLVVELSDPQTPLSVVRGHDRHALLRLMGGGHLDRLTLVSGEAPCVPSARALRPSGRHLRAI